MVFLQKRFSSFVGFSSSYVVFPRNFFFICGRNKACLFVVFKSANSVFSKPTCCKVLHSVKFVESTRSKSLDLVD